MRLESLKKNDLLPFLENLMNSMEVVGVKEKVSGKYEFAVLESPAQLCLDYDVTILPPKKYFLPPRETIFKFQIGPELKCQPVFENKERAIVGIHAYDLKAINQLDRIFADGQRDEHYLQRRRQTMIIGVDIKKASPFAFCKSMNSALPGKGFDLWLTDIGDKFIITVGTEKGAEILKKLARTEPPTPQEVARKQEIQEKIPYLFSLNTVQTPYEELPRLLEEHKESKLFSELAEKCLSCGTCNLVCPTCYCFDVQDELALNLTAGERYRQWDGCLLTDFALVATGENFRKDRAERIRHRLFRKGKYIYEKYGEHGCVGCGRCAAACLPDIANPVEIFNRLKEGKY